MTHANNASFAYVQVYIPANQASEYPVFVLLLINTKNTLSFSIHMYHFNELGFT